MENPSRGSNGKHQHSSIHAVTCGSRIAHRIMGRNLQLPPLVVLIALMIGGQVGGIAGVYLSVPVAAVLRTAWLDYFSVGKLPDAGTKISSPRCNPTSPIVS